MQQQQQQCRRKFGIGIRTLQRWGHLREDDINEASTLMWLKQSSMYFLNSLLSHYSSRLKLDTSARTKNKRIRWQEQCKSNTDLIKHFSIRSQITHLAACLQRARLQCARQWEWARFANELLPHPMLRELAPIDGTPNSRTEEHIVDEVSLNTTIKATT